MDLKKLTSCKYVTCFPLQVVAEVNEGNWP